MKNTGISDEIWTKILEATTPVENRLNVAFDPISPAIDEKIRRIKGAKRRTRIFEAIFKDSRCVLLNDTDGTKTTAYKEHKGWKTGSWEETKKMATALNEARIHVCFLPESNIVSSADAIIKVNKSWRICDFKYCKSIKSNTIACELIKGFKQANTIVLKLENADLGVLHEALDQVLRKQCCGDLLIINRYWKVKHVLAKDIQSGKYIVQLKGLLK